MADILDNHASAAWRADLWSLIRATPALDWLILTKRPSLIAGMLPADWGDGWPNVWLGTTTENQAEAARRIPHLGAIPATVRFLGVEPMLEVIDLDPGSARSAGCSSAARAASATAHARCTPNGLDSCATRRRPAAWRCS